MIPGRAVCLHRRACCTCMATHVRRHLPIYPPTYLSIPLQFPAISVVVVVVVVVVVEVVVVVVSLL